jgi:TrmH family RNA methyltransferase
LYCTEPLFDEVQINLKSIISESDLRKISTLTTPNNCLAIFKIPSSKPIIDNGLIIALEDIRDPGNLGTILRLCDWFGVSQVICTEKTVDLYNPKVVQATMGSISRVNVSYINLKNYLQTTSLPIFGTFMEGSNVYMENLPKQAIVIMGNEANGISSEIENIIKNRLSIPRFGDLQLTESLNVATATAIILSEFRR